jgi:hypothetical protein
MEISIMATYKYSQFITQQDHPAYDQVHTPGTAAPYSGIYRCEACADEYACNKANPLPPQNHNQHPTSAPIRWRLIVASYSR